MDAAVGRIPTENLAFEGLGVSFKYLWKAGVKTRYLVGLSLLNLGSGGENRRLEEAQGQAISRSASSFELSFLFVLAVLVSAQMCIFHPWNVSTHFNRFL